VILLLLIGLAFTGVAVALVARGLANPTGAPVPQPVARIRRYGFTRPRGEQAKAAVGGVVDRAAERVGESVAPRLGGAADTRRELIAAGIYGLSSRKFLGYRVLAAVGLPLIWIWFATTVVSVPGVLALLAMLACGYLGWAIPLMLVKSRGKRRLATIDYELPELIDLLIVTIEAGLGFVGSLQMAATRLRGPLGDELRLTLQEQNMGLAMNEALANTMVRCDTPSMRSFVRSVTQGETLGVSIGHIMRDLATEMRRRRRQYAEERAQKAPVKILFPLVFLIFPAMFIVLLGPALIQFLHAIRNV
jgi:tight adherence protein C